MDRCPYGLSLDAAPEAGSQLTVAPGDSNAGDSCLDSSDHGKLENGLSTVVGC